MLLQGKLYHLGFRGNVARSTLVDFERLFVLTLSSAFFVVPTKSNVLIQRRHSHPVGQKHGRSDQTVILSSFESASLYQDPVRRVSYVDANTGKRLKFLTNNFTLPALTIARFSTSADTWSCSSNGSGSTCGSRPSTASARTL